MLVRNRILITNPNPNVDIGDLYTLLLQEPNDRFVGIFPVKLWMNSIRDKWGEPPQITDKSLVKESAVKLGRYLENLGFYHSKVETEVVPAGDRRSEVIYRITLSNPFIIQNYRYAIPDDSINALITRSKPESLIKPGSLFNSFVLDEERDRLTELLRNNGYFGFTKDYIYFEADTTQPGRQVDLTLRIKPPRLPGADSLGRPRFGVHRKYRIRNITVHPDHQLETDTRPNDYSDTLFVILKNRKTPKDSVTGNIALVYNPPLKIKPRVVTNSLFVAPGKPYNATDAKQTYKKLNELQIYRFVDVNFREVRSSGTLKQDEAGQLDCFINLRRNPVNSYAVELQGTNSGGDLGMAGYLIYQNRNLFRGAEVLNIRLKGAIEAQENAAIPEENLTQWWFFNTFEAGINVSILFPRFFAPVRQEIFSKYFRPKTTLNLGYNIQDRIEYDRVITNVTFGYQWNRDRELAHSLFPLDFSVIKMNTTPAFDSILADESQRFRNQYTDHLILALRYSLLYNNQISNRVGNYYWYRGDVETAGNLLNTIMHTTGQPENELGYNTLFGIRYAQYFRIANDIRYYRILGNKQSVVFRTYAGIAVPYGNSVDIPYEKGFFGGGANGMRAWALRYLGPGSYRTPEGKSSIERVGDIMLEANMEYRFPVYNVLTGAIFYDMGNIWLVRENETYPGGRWRADRFLSELAMDAGLGIRLDFNYFIFRIDFAQRLKDPARNKGDRWVPGNFSGWFKPVVNLGIGHPF
ncbi:MAG: BamA/TamA family outer membrane protein [Bacteroidales bacterium]